jgi:fluoride exporter
VTVLLVLVGGAIGAPLRYVTDLFVQSRHDSVFPWGTFAVNVVGSLILGATAGAVTNADGPTWVLTLVGTGFCGALTTFSTFQVELLGMLDADRAGLALTYAAASLAAGCLGVAAAINLSRRAV